MNDYTGPSVSMHNNPQIDPIYRRGTNGAGVLLLHGFTGTPDSLRPVANRLHEAGFTVQVPLLAGHGTTPEKCAQTNHRDWYQSAQKAFMELNAKCSKIFVSGLSMGGLLTLKLAYEFPQMISGIACLATPIYLKKWVRLILPFIWHSPVRFFWRYQRKMDIDMKDPQAKQNFWNYDQMPLSCIISILNLQHEVRHQLHRIESPTLLIHSRHDSTAPYDSMNMIARGLSARVTETVTLENSYHVITLDFDREMVAKKIHDFFKRLL